MSGERRPQNLIFAYIALREAILMTFYVDEQAPCRSMASPRESWVSAVNVGLTKALPFSLKKIGASQHFILDERGEGHYVALHNTNCFSDRS